VEGGHGFVAPEHTSALILIISKTELLSFKNIKKHSPEYIKIVCIYVQSFCRKSRFGLPKKVHLKKLWMYVGIKIIFCILRFVFFV
jgi:hypothetical protein